MSPECPFCGVEMTLVLAQTRTQGGVNAKMREELYHCEGCGFVAKFAKKPGSEPPYFVQSCEERLRALGYID